MPRRKSASDFSVHFVYFHLVRVSTIEALTCPRADRLLHLSCPQDSLHHSRFKADDGNALSPAEEVQSRQMRFLVKVPSRSPKEDAC